MAKQSRFVALASNIVAIELYNCCQWCSICWGFGHWVRSEGDADGIVEEEWYEIGGAATTEEFDQITAELLDTEEKAAIDVRLQLKTLAYMAMHNMNIFIHVHACKRTYICTCVPLCMCTCV